MKQINKFYWASFLKNQTYFTPIMILFLQFHHLSFREVFLVFTIGSVFNFIIEIPTGVVADLYGKRQSIIISKFLIFVAFLAFAFSTSFWFFVVAQLLYELGQSFRSGTETAYTYDYLQQNPNNPSYTEVKGKQKFYARIGESIAAIIGGFVASQFGYSMVFFVAAVPAFINFLMNISWVKIQESKQVVSLRNSYQHVLESIKQFKKPSLIILVINITIFTSVLAALTKFIQPYMSNAGVLIAMIGVIYSIALGLTALIVRYSYIFEKKFGERKTINVLTLLAVIPALIIGLGYSSIFGVVLFFLIIIIENLRSPIANSFFHSKIGSKERATMGSILGLFKNLGKIIILPLAGYLADAFSMSMAILIMSAILLLNGVIFFVRKEKTTKEVVI